LAQYNEEENMNWKMLALGIPLISALVACPTPVTPSYVLGAPSPASLTFTKPTSGNSAPQTVNLTITLKDGFSSDLTATLVAPSGSTGVTAAPVTIPAGTTTGQLSVVVSSTATEGAGQAYTVQTSGGSVDPQTQPLSITVNKSTTPPTPNFTVAATAPAAVTKPSSGTVQTTSTVTVTPSNGFAGSVALSAAPAPTGVTYSFNPASVNVTSTTAVTSVLTATVSSTASAATTAVTVTGTGTISGVSTPRTATPVNLVINAATTTDNVVLTPPAGFNGKLATNAPVQFTAQARNGTTVLSPQPTITWTSSDPSVVSVDATGLATAKKFSTASVTIKASVGSVDSNLATITFTYGIEMSVGTLNNISGGTPDGTALIAKFRDVNGSAFTGIDAATQNYSLAGPASWNGGTPLAATGSPSFVFNPTLGFGIMRAPPAGTAASVPPVQGDYTLTTTIGGTPYTGKANLANAAQVLPRPSVTATLTGTKVDGSWAAVSGAASYRVQLIQNGAVVQSVNQTTLTVSFTGLTVATNDTFAVRVIAYPVDITSSADVTLPSQFNVSSADSATTPPAP
jgi:hypothetical protein